MQNETQRPSGVPGKIASSLFLLLLIIAFATRQPLLWVVYLIFAGILLLIYRRRFLEMGSKERISTTLLISAMTLMLPYAASRSETSIAHYLACLVSIGCAFLLTRDLECYLQASRVSLVVSQLIVCAYLFMAGLDSFPLEDMIPNSSSNGVTSYLVILQINYCVINFLLHRQTALVTSLVTLFICFVGFGRGSFISSAVIVMVSLIFTLTARSRATAAIGSALLLAAVVAYSKYDDEIWDYVERNTKMGRGIQDFHRELMIDEYLNKIEGWELITGADYQGTRIASDYGGNPHNSYIRAHHIFGLPYLLLTLGFPFIVLNRKQPRAVKAFSLIFLIIAHFRAFTEPILFPTFFDLFYFACCFAMSKRAPDSVAPKIAIAAYGYSADAP